MLAYENRTPDVTFTTLNDRRPNVKRTQMANLWGPGKIKEYRNQVWVRVLSRPNLARVIRTGHLLHEA